MKRWTIYCHIHRDSGRRYIGQTARTWQRRWSQHVVQARAATGKTCHFANAIRKYGKDAFDHEILETCATVEEANAAEEKWIAHFNTRDPGKGFNVLRGGGHAPHPSKNPWDRPDYREKVTASIRSHWQDPAKRVAHSDAIAVHLRTPESRAKHSEAQRGKTLTAEHRGKISDNMRRLCSSLDQDERVRRMKVASDGRRRRALEADESEKQIARERHSRASKSAYKSVHLRSPKAVAAHRESCRMGSKYAHIDAAWVLGELRNGRSKASVARELGIDRGTLYRALAESQASTDAGRA